MTDIARGAKIRREFVAGFLQGLNTQLSRLAPQRALKRSSSTMRPVMSDVNCASQWPNPLEGLQAARAASPCLRRNVATAARRMSCLESFR